MGSKWWVFLAAGLQILAVSSCAKESGAKCGPGTTLNDGVCVVAEAASASGSATPAIAPASPKPTIKCADSCKKVAECKGLNADAPLVAAGCNSTCTELTEVGEADRDAYLLCVEKAACGGLADCATTLAKATTPKMREAKGDDPVVVLKATVGRGDYGIGTEVRISYKNVSAKDLDALKFYYFCTNNFGDPVGTGRLIAQDKIKAGKADSGTWSIYKDTCTKVKVTVTDVHFTDDTNWVAD